MVRQLPSSILLRRILLYISCLTLALIATGCTVIRYPAIVSSGGDADFSIAVTPVRSTVVAGSAAPAYSFTITPYNGFHDSVGVTGMAPSGTACAPVSCTVIVTGSQAANALQFTPSAATVAGDETITFTAVSGAISHTVTATLTVTPQPTQTDFSIAVTPVQSTVVAGSTAPAYSFTVTPYNGFQGSIGITGLPPSGVVCAPVNCTATITGLQATNVLQFTVAATTAAGDKTISFVAASGGISHTVTATLTVTAAPPPPDFSITVTPVRSSVVAGSAAPAYSFTITPYNGFQGNVGITGSAPAGTACAPVSCTATVTGLQATNVLQFTPASTTAAGDETLTFTAVSGALSHSVTATLTVTAPPPPPPPDTSLTPVCSTAVPTSSTPANSRTGFVYTGDPNPQGVVYDRIHNQIFATNLQLNEVDVISPETMAIVQKLPVPQPMGIDISADGSTLIIGTRTHYLYRASISPLCMTDRQFLGGGTVSPMYPTAMADGSILISAHDVNTTADGFYRWTSAGGFQTVAVTGSYVSSIKWIVPSGDRQHAYFSGDDSGGLFGRFDVSTGSAIATTVAFGTQPTVLAVNQDGSRVLINEDCCGVTLTDSNFKTVATYSGVYVEGAIGTPDFSRIYLKDITTNYLLVLNGANLTATGSVLTNFVPTTFDRTEFRAFDGSNRILATASDGLALIDLSKVIPIPAPGASVPAALTGGGIYGAMQPSTPESGYKTSLNGAGFPSESSSIAFYEQGSGPLTAVGSPAATIYSGSGVSLTAPVFTSGCADVLGTFQGGDTVFAPQAYCYSPTVYLTDGDTGSTAGGGTMTLYALGLGSKPTVTVGNTPATTATIGGGYSSSGVPFTMFTLPFTAPAGVAGDADVTVTTSFGSTTLPGAYHYAQRTDTNLPAGAVPFQLLYDDARGRILITDSAHAQLLIYAAGSGSLLNTIATGATPQGIALTPDGTRLLLLTAGDYKLSVLDASNYTTLQQATLPTTASTLFGSSPSGPPQYIAAMANGKAYVETKPGYLQTGAGPYFYPFLFDYDLGTNTLSPDPFNRTSSALNGGYSIASSADGSAALIAGQLAHSVGGSLTASETGVSSYGDMALSADAYLAASNTEVLNSQFHGETVISAPAPVSGGVFGETFLSEAQMNASGSLYYRAAQSHIRIYDVRHGILVRTLQVPDGLTGANGERLMAIPTAGRQIVAVTGAGLSQFTFATDPLSIGEVTLAGTQLTLLGSGLDSTSTLTLDTQPTAATVSGTTRMVATLPANLAPGSHSITVTAANGRSYILTLAFTTP